MDDDSDSVSDSDPRALRDKIETEAGLSAQWLKDNRLCVAADKSKLLVTGTQQLRGLKLPAEEEMRISVDQKEIVESSSEKLLGLIINNQLTWKNYMYGNEENPGLVSQLGKRIGMLKMLSKYMNKEKLKLFVNGLFYSKLSYCLPVFGNIFGVEKYKEKNRRYLSFTTKDNFTLQTLQNKVNRILIDAEPLTSTTDLLRLTGSLSIHQLVAYQTAVLTHKIVQAGKPCYIADRMKPRQTNLGLRGGAGLLQLPQCKLSVSREGFIYRGAFLYNMLDENMRVETDLSKFKKKLKEWTRLNISIKPKPYFSKVIEHQKKERSTSADLIPISRQTPTQPRLNTITRYFAPI